MINPPRRENQISSYVRAGCGFLKIYGGWCRKIISVPQILSIPCLFHHGVDVKNPIASMPGQFQFSVDKLADEIRSIRDLGIPAVILFGIPEHKDPCGTDNYSTDGVIARAIQEIKHVAPEIVVISDMCFCEYTDHGHCGIINDPKTEDYDFSVRLPEGYLLNDPTLELLGQVHRSYMPKLVRTLLRRQAWLMAWCNAIRAGSG